MIQAPTLISLLGVIVVNAATGLAGMHNIAVVVLCSVAICGCVQGAYIIGHRHGQRSCQAEVSRHPPRSSDV